MGLRYVDAQTEYISDAGASPLLLATRHSCQGSGTDTGVLQGLPCTGAQLSAAGPALTVRAQLHDLTAACCRVVFGLMAASAIGFGGFTFMRPLADRSHGCERLHPAALRSHAAQLTLAVHTQTAP